MKVVLVVQYASLSVVLNMFEYISLSQRYYIFVFTLTRFEGIPIQSCCLATYPEG